MVRCARIYRPALVRAPDGGPLVRRTCASRGRVTPQCDGEYRKLSQIGGKSGLLLPPHVLYPHLGACTYARTRGPAAALDGSAARSPCLPIRERQGMASRNVGVMPCRRGRCEDDVFTPRTRLCDVSHEVTARCRESCRESPVRGRLRAAQEFEFAALFLWIMLLRVVEHRAYSRQQEPRRRSSRWCCAEPSRRCAQSCG